MRKVSLLLAPLSVGLAVAQPTTLLAQESDQSETVLTGSEPDAAALGPICTDRPTKGTAVCTVPEGSMQIESDLFFWSRTDAGGARNDVFLYTNPTIKYGVGPDTDIQLNIAPVVEVRSTFEGVTRSQTGVGDLTLRIKQRFTSPDDDIQVGIVPFVKAPTAERGIGNGEWEGGVTLPVQVPVGAATLTLVSQLNLLADALDAGDRHLEYQGVVNLGFPIADRVAVAVELWTSQDWDPAGTIRQYSADTAFTYLVNDELQLDFGGNFGLNQATPDVQLYVGLSTRF